MNDFKLEHYRRVKVKRPTGYVLCQCGHRISANKHLCLACASSAEAKAQQDTPDPRETENAA